MLSGWQESYAADELVEAEIRTSAIRLSPSNAAIIRHYPFIEQPAQFNEAVLEFLAAAASTE
jgi:pimeloyl-ACP methyl ester carboxylesterase